MLRTLVIVAVVLVLLLLVAGAVVVGRRNQRRARLRERFGPEYDIALRRGPDRRAVEERLTAVAERRDALQLRSLPESDHERFTEAWARAQAGFVDDPGQAVADADGAVNAVMRSRGYPVESLDDRAALLAIDHQDLVERYRDAHDAYADHLRGGSVATERLRVAFLHYRDVFERLNEAEPAAAGAPEAPPQLPASAPDAPDAPATGDADPGNAVAAVRLDAAPEPAAPEPAVPGPGVQEPAAPGRTAPDAAR